MPIKTIISGVIASLLAVFVFFDGWYTVEQGERAVVLRAGALKSVAEPGFHLRMPFVDSVRRMEIRTQSLRLKDVASYSRDIQQSNSTVTVNYELPPAKVAGVYAQYGLDYQQRVVRPAVYDKFKEVFGRYTAAEIVAQRQKVGNEVMQAIADELRQYGLEVKAVQVENVDFSDEFEHAIEKAVKAKAEVTEAEQVLLRKKIEAQQIVVAAHANADAARQKASGQADAIKLTAQAEADALRLKGEALAANPQLIDLKAVERWNGATPVTMVPGSTVPFIGLK